MKNLYNNLSNREKKLIFVSLSLLVILIVFWSVNTVALKISVLKNQYQTSSSEYSYVLNKAKIISRSLSSAQIGLLESDIKVPLFVTKKEDLTFISILFNFAS